MKQIKQLFGLPFLFAGIAAFYFFVYQPLQDAWQMQSWNAVPAQLISAEVTSYQSRNDDGGYTTMYELEMQYRYQVAGVSYTSDRATISGYSSNDSNEHYQRLGEIQRQQSSAGGLQVWVNPGNPADAVFDREPDWIVLIMLSLFSAIFILVGGGLSLYGLLSNRAYVEPAQADPLKPWTRHKGWASPQVYSNAKSSYRLYWFLALLALIFIGVFAVAFFRIEPWIGQIVAVFGVLVSGLLARKALHQQRAWNFFRKVPVTLDPFPGVIGGHVAGTLTLPGLPQSTERYSASLECIHHWTERSGKETRSEQAVVWSGTQVPTVRDSATGTELRFDFYVPASCEPTSEPDNNFHRWILNIKADLPGIVFDRRYELPVYVTEQSQTVAEELQADPLSMDETAAMYDRLAVETAGQGITLQTPGSKSGWIIGGMGAAFFIIGAAIALFGSGNFGMTFASVSLFFVAAGVWMVGRNCYVRVTPEQCDVDVFLFSRPIKQHRIPARSIVGVEAYRSSSTQTNGRRTDEKFALRIYLDSCQIIDLGGEFSTMRNAEHMRQEILDIIGLEMAD